MKIHPENEDNLINYSEKWNEYNMNVDNNIQQRIYFCPWCGERLPESQRDNWFDELESMGIDPMNDEIPIEYQSEEWRIG